MKLLVSIGLADRSLKYHIAPLTELKEVEKIIIVRDRKGPILKKVLYYTPPVWSLKSSILKTVFKLLILIYLSIRENPHYLHGYLLFPDGINVFLAGKLTNKKKGVSLIAGPVELFILGGSPIEKYAYTTMPEIRGVGRILYLILKRFDIITVTGSFTKKFLLKNDIPDEKIKILPHAVSASFKPLSIPKEFDLVYVGRLAKVKHVENLVMAINIVKKNYQDVKFAIIGDGPEEESLKALSKKLNLDKNVYFLGYKSDTWNWFNRAKFSILASEREGLSHAVLESLSCGIPVIASKCGDISDIIKNNYNGIIINDYRDKNSFAQAILELLNNPLLAKKYSENARKSTKNMDEGIVSSVWVDIIDRIRREK